MNTNEKIEALRKLMRAKGMTYYYIPTDDYHMSEYTGAYFKERAYMSGFKGSAGYLLVGLDDAYLFVDGRYFLQAEIDLRDTCIQEMKMSMPGVPTLMELLKSRQNVVLGFDGRTVGASLGEQFASIEGIQLVPDVDLVDKIWKDRPEISKEKASLLDVKYAGKSASEKLGDFQKAMTDLGGTCSVLTSIDDIMWLLNLRGNDVACNPVALSYLIVYKDYADLFIHEEILSKEIMAAMEEVHVIVHEYDDFYKAVSKLKDEVIVLDKAKINYRTLKEIDASNKIIVHQNLSTLPKAIKNETEQKWIRLAHEKDGAAVIKFINYVKKHYKTEKMTELSASAILENYRAQNENFRGLSFGTIAGFGPHGAIIHYGPTEETDAVIEDNNFLLVDSGAQYLEGTTDITRTIVLGKVSDQMKRDFTLVLKGYLALSDAVFLEGVTGACLDYAAREPIWRSYQNYNHGTGHGVGFFLNVHEGPQRINYNSYQAGFKAGMLTSDEPGLYIPGQYGIRHESLVLAQKVAENEWGTFLQFESVTLVPFDKNGLDLSILTEEEIEKLNAYHARVLEKESKYLSGDDLEFLRDACAPIVR